MQSFFQSCATATFFTFTNDDYYATVFYCTPCVIHGFLQLVNVNIFRITTARSNNYICRFINFYAINFIYKFTSFNVSTIPIASKDFYEFFFSIKNCVEQEEFMFFSEKTHAFHLVIIHRVTVQFAKLRVRAHHQAVISAYSFHCRYARENSLTTTAEPCKEVVYDSTGHNNQVHITDKFINPNGSTKRGFTKIFKVVCCVAITVIHGQAFSNIFTNCFYHFFISHFAMSTKSENNTHIFVFNAELVHFIYQHRHKVKAISYASGIIANERNFLTWFN